MLQQTRVETVIPYYNRWVERFPTPAALAAAPEEEVLKAWEGLGYYSRARNLQQAAREVVARYGGEVPSDPDAFAGLPGVGRYTTGAVLSIAYGRPLPAVDGNVLRVISRLFALEADITAPAARRQVEAVVADLIPRDRAAEFNQALMELGALVCLPGQPQCQACPVAAHCLARTRGRERELPFKRRKAPPRPETVLAAVVADGGEYLLARRPGRGLLAGLWEFPSVTYAGGTGGAGAAGSAGGTGGPGCSPEAALRAMLAERFGIQVRVGGLVARVEHIFSHRRWDLLAFQARLEPLSPRPRERDGLRWLTSQSIAAVPLPAVFQKVAAALLERGAAR